MDYLILVTIGLLAVAAWRLLPRTRPNYGVYAPLVIDGDTIFADGVKYRLHGIDAPEMGQTGGKAAKGQLEKLLRNRFVTIEVIEADRYGRKVAKLYTDKGDICRTMVETGYARAYFHPDYRGAQHAAQAGKAGLWKLKGGMPDPGAFRRASRR